MKTNRILLALLLIVLPLFPSCSAYRIVATVADDGTLQYGGESYFPVFADDGTPPVFVPGEQLGRMQDTARVKTVKDDAQGDYLCVVSGSARRLYAKQPTTLSGGTNITSVFFEYKGGFVLRYDSPDALNEVLSLKTLKGDPYSFSYQEGLSEPVFVYFAYDNSPVAAEWFGEITKIGDTFVFVPRGSRSAGDAGNFKSSTLCDGIVIADNDYITRLALLTGVE